MTIDPDTYTKAGRDASGLLSALCASIRAGQTTREVAARAGAMTAAAGFAPATCDASPWCSVNLNEEACHALPGDRIIRAGDLATIDLAVRTTAAPLLYIDLAKTIVVGQDPRAIDPARRELAHATVIVNKAVLDAINIGGKWSRAATAGRAAAEALGFAITPGFPGHGIGLALHAPPVAGYHGEADFSIEPGMAFTIEPILVRHPPNPQPILTTLEDGWTVLTTDGRDAAFAEWTVLIGAKGPRVIAS